MTEKARTDKEILTLQAVGLTDTGRVRKNNEDSFLVERPDKRQAFPRLICMVADGMGGQDYGEVASQLAVKIFHQEAGQLTDSGDVAGWLKNTVIKVHREVRRQLDLLRPGNGMGSTLVAGVFSGQQCCLANVGDSRAYLLRDGTLHRITKDHSLMEVMLDKGLIQAEEVYTHPRRGELTRYIGQPAELDVDISVVDHLKAGDVMLFCSDGLWEMVRDAEMASILRNSSDLIGAGAALINRANQSGGADNITAVVVQVTGNTLLVRR